MHYQKDANCGSKTISKNAEIGAPAENLKKKTQRDNVRHKQNDKLWFFVKTRHQLLAFIY